MLVQAVPKKATGVQVTFLKAVAVFRYWHASKDKDGLGRAKNYYSISRRLFSP